MLKLKLKMICVMTIDISSHKLCEIVEVTIGMTHNLE